MQICNLVASIWSHEPVNPISCSVESFGKVMMTIQNINPRQKKFLERLRSARERLLQAIEGLDPEILSNSVVIDDWTVKDLLGHIVSWNDEFRAEIEMILVGKHPGYEYRISAEDDFSAWNQAWISKKRSWSWQCILADLDRDYQQAADLILRLQPEDYRQRGVTPWKPAAINCPENPTKKDTDSVETLVTFHWRHSNQHIKQIEKWRHTTIDT
jgi:uncharacterized damage-inducible protein DinB